MNVYDVSRRGRIEVAVRYTVSWLLLAALFLVPLRYVGYPKPEFPMAVVGLIALVTYLAVQWFRIALGKWRISFSDATVELPSIGEAEVESIEGVRRFWRGPGQHCLMVKFRKETGKILSRTATIYPQYYERGPELEARIMELGHQQ